MTNDYLKGHSYRMKTDKNYRLRHTGPKVSKPVSGKRCYRCGARASEYHHTNNHTKGYPICKTCHKRLHGGYPRGKTPHS